MAFSRQIHGAIDSAQETVGTVLKDISIDAIRITDTQDAARNLIISKQSADFICLLKLYRKVYSHRMKMPKRECEVFKSS